MEREVRRLSDGYVQRRIREQETLIQQLRDDTLASGAMPGEFQIVQVFRRGHPEHMHPRLR